MSARGYWILAGAWTLAMALAWTLWFLARAEERAVADRERAQAARALAALQATPPQPPSRPRAVDEARLMADVAALAATPRATDEARAAARKYIAHALVAAGYQPDLQSFPEGINVVAERPGTDAKAGAILVGAHFDTVPDSPGADDDASGVAAALEVARLLFAEPTPRALRVVFFDGEERGLLGSAAYASSPTRRADLRGAIILEMLGYACATPGCQQVAPGTPAGLTPPTGDFLAVVGDLQHLELLRAFRQAAGGLTVVTLPVPMQGAELPDARRSDHVSFWNAGVGAVMVTDTANLRNPHYHRPTDTVETLDPKYLAAATQVVVHATAALLAPAAPKPGAATPGSTR